MAPTEETNSGQSIEIANSYDVTLSKAIRGTPVLPNAAASFTVNWKGIEGYATLTSLDGAQIGIELHPLGISGRLAFMSDMKPTAYDIAGTQVTIFRIILNLDSQGENGVAAIMFNQDGSVIEGTTNWADDDTSYDQVPPQS